MPYIEIPDNLIAVGFNDTSRSVYNLLGELSKNIAYPFQLVEYFPDSKDEKKEVMLYEHALFYARISYFDTHVFLIKNFSWSKDEQGLFDEIGEKIHYLVQLRPQRMYILMIYSNEIRNLEDAGRFIKAKKSGINLSLIASKRIISRLHFSVSPYLP